MKQLFTCLLLLLFIAILVSCTAKELSPEAKKYQEIEESLSPGNPFPDFAFKNNLGKDISQADFKKGDVFYMFWATWCGSCIDNIAAVRDMRKKGLLEDVQFVSISVDKEEEKWKQMISQYDMDDYMDNILLGRDREHPLSDFLFGKFSVLPKDVTKDMDISKLDASKLEEKYSYMAPSYCLVKDGKIVDNSPATLSEDREAFLAQFEK